MIEATIPAPDFARFVNIIGALVTECRLHVEVDGIRACAVDTANVAMVCIEVPEESFSHYEVIPEEIGLDITILKNWMTLAKPVDTLHLHRAEGSKTFDIEFGQHRFSVETLDLTTIRRDPNPPTIELPGQIAMDGAAFADAIKGACIVSDKVMIDLHAHPGYLYVRAKGGKDIYRNDFKGAGLVVEKMKEVGSCFSLDYLKDLAKIMEEYPIRIYLGQEHPVKFEFSSSNLSASYLLAPRIEEPGEGCP